MSRAPKNVPGFGYGRPVPWVDMTGGPSLRELEPVNWHPDAACSGSTNWAWFNDGKGLRTQESLSVCGDCPVRRTCLASALVFAEAFGIWGGFIPPRRKPMLHALARGARLGDVLDAALRPGQRRDVA